MREEESFKETSKKPSWIKTKPEDLKRLVIDLYKEGNTPVQIGVILRDKHGIPKAKLLGRKISKILIESGIDHSSNKIRVNKKIERIKSHIKKNKKDHTASRALTKKLWNLYHLNQSET